MLRHVMWKTLEWGLLPDWLIRIKIRYGLSQFLNYIRGDGDVERLTAAKAKFIEDLTSMPIAINQSDANQQHYELPSIFFKMILGPNMKYSSGYWPSSDSTLAESEEHILEMYCERAELADAMTILDSGCGWGSLTLYLAKKYPKSRIVSLSNSSSQRVHILDEASKLGLKNVIVYTGDIASFDRDDLHGTFDRIISIEMFEHMKNYEKLMEKLSHWLCSGGKLFVHIFCHKQLAYHFTKGWMAKAFFTGGTMPSEDLLLHFQKHLTLQKRWCVNGMHYSKTLEAWLRIFDFNYEKIMPIFDATYGKDQSSRWYAHWRMFFIVCSETFAYNEGNEWFVSHYLFIKQSKQ